MSLAGAAATGASSGESSVLRDGNTGTGLNGSTPAHYFERRVVISANFWTWLEKRRTFQFSGWGHEGAWSSWEMNQEGFEGPTAHTGQRSWGVASPFWLRTVSETSIIGFLRWQCLHMLSVMTHGVVLSGPACLRVGPVNTTAPSGMCWALLHCVTD